MVKAPACTCHYEWIIIDPNQYILILKSNRWIPQIPLQANSYIHNAVLWKAYHLLLIYFLFININRFKSRLLRVCDWFVPLKLHRLQRRYGWNISSLNHRSLLKYSFHQVQMQIECNICAMQRIDWFSTKRIRYKKQSYIYDSPNMVPDGWVVWLKCNNVAPDIDRRIFHIQERRI